MRVTDGRMYRHTDVRKNGTDFIVPFGKHLPITSGTSEHILFHDNRENNFSDFNTLCHEITLNFL